MSEHQGNSKAARLADSIKDAFTDRSEDERDAGWERREAAGTAERDAGAPGQRHGDPDAPPLAGPGAGPGDAPGGRPAEDRTAGGDPRAARVGDPGGDLPGGDPRGIDPHAGDLPGGAPRTGDPRAGGLPGGDPRGADPRGGYLPGGDPHGGPGAPPHDAAPGSAAGVAAAATTRGAPVREDGALGGSRHDATPGRGHDDLRDPGDPRGGATGPGAGAAPAATDPATGGSSLLPADRSREYQDRWSTLKGEFVDEPRRAVHGANALVGEILDEMESLFRRQRDDLEAQFSRDDASTEDLRQALTRYREFFDRLLSL